MLILAVDSSTPVAGVALVEDHRVLNESFINYKKMFIGLIVLVNLILAVGIYTHYQLNNREMLSNPEIFTIPLTVVIFTGTLLFTVVPLPN